jgi:hypothetical protein
MMGMANGKWKSFIASPSMQLTLADGVKNFLLQYIGNHKRAFAMLDYDFSESLPSINRQFCGAIIYDGFTVSSWTRSNISDLQTNNATSGVDYWTSTYGLQLGVTDSVIILVDMDS